MGRHLAATSFSLPELFPLHAQPPADFHHQELQRVHSFISLFSTGLLSVIRCGDEALFGLPLWSPLSMRGEEPLGERGQAGGPGSRILHMRLRNEDPIHLAFICL